MQNGKHTTRFTKVSTENLKGTWLVKQGMERVYGTMKIRMTVKDLYEYICRHNNIDDVVCTELQGDGYKV